MQWVGNSYTFDTRMEDPEAEPVKVVVNGSEIIDIEVQQRLVFGFIALILFPAWARARAQREQPHFFYQIATPSTPNFCIHMYIIFTHSQAHHLQHQSKHPIKPNNNNNKLQN